MGSLSSQLLAVAEIYDLLKKLQCFYAFLGFSIANIWSPRGEEINLYFHHRVRTIYEYHSKTGFLNLNWTRWKRVLFTRSIAIVPTLALTLTSGVDGLTGFNDLLNVLMSIQLPFAVLPLLTFTNDIDVMGEYRNSRLVKVSSGCLLF